MKPQIGLMGQLTTKDLLDDLDFAIKNDFNWFELALDWPQNFNLSNKTVLKIKKRSKKNNIKLIVHTPFYLPTSTLLPEIREGLFKNVKKAIELATKLDSDRITIHPGYREMPSVVIEKTYSSLVSNLKKIVKMGSKNNVYICLENLDVWGNNLCSSYSDYTKVLESVPNIKATLDIGHTNTGDKNPVDFFKSVEDKLMDMHIHDNDGSKDQHNLMGEGNIDFIKLFKACKKANYKGPFILELFPYENIKKGKKRLKKAWHKA